MTIKTLAKVLTTAAPIDKHYKLAGEPRPQLLGATNPGQDLEHPQMIQELVAQLGHAAGRLIPLKTPVNKQLRTKAWAATPNKVDAVAKVFSDMDFTVTKTRSSKTVSGLRVETDGVSTYVGYFGASGLLAIATNAPSLDV